MRMIYVDDERSAHINFSHDMKSRADVGTVTCFYEAEDALDYAKDNPVDCAFLDVDLGGAINGIALAEKLRALKPHIEVVFVTAHDEYARKAFQVGGCGYLTKPYTQDELDSALDVLQRLTHAHRREEAVEVRPQQRVRMKTFGNFDLLVDNRPVAFKNAKAKELLAYLVHQKGGTSNSAQIFLTLWEEQEYSSSTSTYVRRTVRALKDELENQGVSDIFICTRNCYSIDPTRFVCDYYNIMAGKDDDTDHFTGEYMNQYSWGESTVPIIARKVGMLK